MECVDGPWWIVAIKNYPPLPYPFLDAVECKDIHSIRWLNGTHFLLDVLNMYVAVNNSVKLVHIPECCMWAVMHCHQHVSIHCLLCMPLVFSYLYHNHCFMHSCFWALHVMLASILYSILCAPDICATIVVHCCCCYYICMCVITAYLLLLLS